MTDNSKSFPARVPALGNPESMQHPELSVTLKLPLEIANAIAQRISQSGQTQTQVILEALALTLKETGQEVSLGETVASVHPILEELEQLKRRLADLETLVPKVAMLEGKSIAF